MAILLAILLCWLALTVLFTLLCRMAAQGDDAPMPSLHESEPGGIEELLIWEALARPTLRDTRPTVAARSASPAQDAVLSARS
jgi:hypothetical protein